MAFKKSESSEISEIGVVRSGLTRLKKRQEDRRSSRFSSEVNRFTQESRDKLKLHCHSVCQIAIKQ